MSNPIRNTQKLILVTGGSRGIGKAIINRFKAEGWLTATCASHIKNLQDSPADFHFACDISRAEEVRHGVMQVLQNFGKIDALINNAGISGSNPMEPESSDEAWYQIINTNLNGTYLMCKQVIPHLPNQTGRIINISSVLGLKGVPDASAYCAAKHGVIGLTRSLAHYLAHRRITVNAICPGWTRTEMAKLRMTEIGISENDVGNSVPLGRFIEPQEVADFAYYLVTSPGSAMITGQSLTIDGGTLA